MGDEQMGEQLVRALAERDVAKLEALFAPDVRLRALVPPGPIEEHGAAAVASRMGSWVTGPAAVELLASDVSPVADRLKVSYRFRQRRDADGPAEVFEQVMFCDVHGDALTAIDLVCSGDRPESSARGVERTR